MNTDQTIKRIFQSLLIALFLQSTARAATVALDPIFSGTFTNGNGANSHWAQVQNNWQGPSTFSQQYGGISSLEDANTALAMTASSSGFMRSTDAVVSNINAGNDWFNQAHGSTWGNANMPPLFNTGDPNQENYAGHIWGYIAVPTAGNYNFGVLYDDGFAFTIWGGNGSQSISMNGLNPPDRLGFSSDLSMLAGLYRFDLVGYNRLESGVLNLGWWYGPDTSEFALISQSNLYTSPVPIPAAAWLFGSGLLGLIGVVWRGKRTPGK